MEVPLTEAQIMELSPMEVKGQKWLTISVAGPDYAGCRFPDGPRFAPHRCFETAKEAHEWVEWLTTATVRQAPILTLPTNFAILLTNKQEHLTCTKYQTEGVKSVFEKLAKWKEREKKRIAERCEKVQIPLDPEAKAAPVPASVQQPPRREEIKEVKGKIDVVPHIRMSQYAMIPEMFRDEERSCVLMTCIYRIGVELLPEPLVIFHLFCNAYRGEADILRICKRWQEYDPDFWLGRTLTVANCHSWCDASPTRENSQLFYGSFDDKDSLSKSSAK